MNRYEYEVCAKDWKMNKNNLTLHLQWIKKLILHGVYTIVIFFII